MSKMLDTYLLVSMVIFLSLSLLACDKNEGKKPKAETQASAQIDQSIKPVKPTTTSVAPTIISETEAARTDTVQPLVTTPEPKSATTIQQQTLRKEKMLALARKSGCLACHSIDKKVVGPAWKEVAKRYKGNSEVRQKLIEKVSRGGRGNWSEIVGNVAMPPYYPRVTRENIENLVDFVLSL